MLRNNEPGQDPPAANLPSRKSESITSAKKPNLLAADTKDIDEKSRHSDTQLFKQYVNANQDGEENKATDVTKRSRKLHSKSFSLTENRIMASLGSNMFQQNRELWEKRAELQSQHSLSTPRILSRNRIAPDLVMDLPVPGNQNEPITSSCESLNSNDCGESSGNTIEDMTSAERFASQNQCTLKKNEKFTDNNTHVPMELSDIKKEVKLDFRNPSTCEKPKAEVKPQESAMRKNVIVDKIDGGGAALADEPLHIDEDTKNGTCGTSDAGHSTVVKEKSPIPLRNTKKFVSQFADMHLTGGCLTAAPNHSASVESSAISASTDKLKMSSFKPHVKVKPQVLRKPIILPPTASEASKPNQD